MTTPEPQAPDAGRRREGARNTSLPVLMSGEREQPAVCRDGRRVHPADAGRKEEAGAAQVRDKCISFSSCATSALLPRSFAHVVLNIPYAQSWLRDWGVLSRTLSSKPVHASPQISCSAGSRKDSAVATGQGRHIAVPAPTQQGESQNLRPEAERQGKSAQSQPKASPPTDEGRRLIVGEGRVSH